MDTNSTPIRVEPASNANMVKAPIGVEPPSNTNLVEAPVVNQSEQPQNTNTEKNRRR